MIELWEIVLQYRKICHSVKNIFGLRVKSPYFIVFLEKMMLPQLFPFYISQHCFSLPPPKSIDWFNFQNTMSSSFLSPDVRFLDRVDGR